MTEPTSIYDADTALTKLIKLFGPPPLLRNEQYEDFKEVFAGLFAALGPEDFLMEVQVYHLAIETRLIFRLTRYEAVKLNKWEKEDRVLRANMMNDINLEGGTKEIREKYPHVANTDPKYQNAIAELHESLAADYEQAIIGTATDEDYIQGSSECAAFIETLELRINRAHKRRDNILRQIAWQRLGLSKKLRKFSDAIIEGTGGSLAATSDMVPLIPTGEVDDRPK